MNRDETQVGGILHALQERAKELNCLYQVEELLNQLDTISGGDISRHHRSPTPRLAIPERVPSPDYLRKQSVEPSNFQATPWVQKANIVVQGETVGAVEVWYRRADAEIGRRAVPQGRAQAD